MEKALNFDFGRAEKSPELLTEYPQFTSDLDFFESKNLALDGQNGNELIPIALDVQHIEAYNTSTFSDIFHVGENAAQENYPLISQSKIDSDFVDELTGEHYGYESVLIQAESATINHLRELSQDANLDAKLEEVFGAEQNFELTQTILKDLAQEGSLSLPKIEVLDSEILEGADGAYAKSTETIYLSDKFLTQNQNNPDEVTQVLLEEFGHHLDVQINETDTPGDEGAIFAHAFNLKPALSAEELAAISVEDDSSTIIIDNQLLLVENNIGAYPGYIFKYEAGQSLTYDANVEDWQEAINNLGWDIAVDGLYGSESRSAALEFQQQHDDLTNDGIVGENTWNKILDLLDNDTESQPIESTPFSGTADNAEREILEEREQLLEEKADLESQIERLGTSSPSVTDALQDQLEEVEAQLNELNEVSSSAAEDPSDDPLLDDRVSVYFDAFIPQEVIEAPLNQRLISDKEYYEGDNRGFEYDGSYRIRQTFVIDLNAENPQPISLKQEIGETLALNENKVVVDSGFADTDGLSIEVMKESDLINIDVEASANNPLVTGSPNIDYIYDLSFSLDNKKLDWTLEGKHDGFPAYSVYIGESLIYSHDPNNEDQTAFSLFGIGKGEFEVDESGSFDLTTVAGKGLGF